jgi:hypothetical protein
LARDNLHPSILGCFADEPIIEAIGIIIAAALLLVPLGVYIYLGGKAEGMLLKNNGNTKNDIKRGLSSSTVEIKTPSRQVIILPSANILNSSLLSSARRYT